MADSSTALDALLSKIHAPSSKTSLKVLIYGLPGVGKTTLAASAPNGLIVDVENGTTSLKTGPYKDSNILAYKSYNQVDFLIDMARKGELDNYDSLMIDSISEMQARCLEAHLVAEGKQYSPTWSEYSYNTNQLRALFHKLSELEQHVVLTAAVKEEKSPTDQTTYRLDLPPRLSGMITAMVDVVGYLDLVKETNPTTKEVTVTRRLIIQSPSDRIIAKSRIGGDILLNPTFNDLLKLNNQTSTDNPDKE